VSRGMNIAFITPSISRAFGGIYEIERSLGLALVRLPGIELAVYGLNDEHAEADRAAWLPLTPQTFPVKGPRAFGYSPGLSAALRADTADVGHLHGLWMYTSAATQAWGRRHRRPYVVTPNGMLEPWALRNSAWKKRIACFLYERKMLTAAACLQANTEKEAADFRAFGLKNPIAIIPNGVEMPEDRDQVTGDRGQGTGRKTLLFLGRIHPKKGLVNALKAWAQLSHSKFNIQNSTFHEWQFVVSGWDQGGHEAELKRLCRELGLAYAETAAEEMLSVVGCRLSASLDGASHTAKHPGEGPVRGSSGARGGDLPTTDNGQRTTAFPSLSPDPCPLTPVVFTGPVFGEAKDALLRRADAFILPSYSEGLPMAVLEAWAYGLPVLMTDHCNLPEGFAANAALRIGTDVESIAEGLRELLSLPTTDNGQRTTSLASMGQRGRALVERQFTWPQVAAQMKEVYEWVVGGGRPPDCVRQF